MAMGERTLEVLVLLALSCAAFLMMFVGVSSWSDLNQPIQVSSQSQGSAGDMPPWIYHDIVIREVRDVKDGGVSVKSRSYFDGVVGFIGNQLGNPFGLWSGEESRPGQELEEENGVVANLRSFFTGIGDSVKSWGRKTISPPTILHATEPLGRIPHRGMPPTPTLESKLTAILGRVLEAYYADNVALEDVKLCSGILEEQTRKLVKSLKHQLKEKICSVELLSVKEEKFCNFYSSHPKLATLMVFSKMDVDPIGVALMRTTTLELCANGILLHSVHKLEKLVRRLRISSSEVGHNGFAVDDHEHEHEHERKHQAHDGLSMSYFDVEEGQSCQDCYLQGIHSFMEDIKTRLTSICHAPTACMQETCTFVKEHRDLTKTYLVMKTRPWEIVTIACVGSCHSSPFPLGMSLYPHMAVSQSHAPNHPGEHGVIRGVDIERPRVGISDPDMPVSHPSEIAGFTFRRSSRCHRLARLQAFRRAMQLRGNILGSSDSDGGSGLEGNGQAHLVIVVNGHPFGPSNIRGIFSSLRNHMNTPMYATLTSSHSDPRPEPWSDVVLSKPFHEQWHVISAWKDTQSTDNKIDLQGHAEHQTEDSFVGENPHVESLPQVSGKTEEDIPSEGDSTGQAVALSVEESDGRSTTGTSAERALEDSPTSSDSDLRESMTSSGDSSEEGSRAAM